MPKGRKITRMIELEVCTLRQSAEEFYRHNRVKGLSKDTQQGYREYVERFIKWCGEDTETDTITTKTLDKYMEYLDEQGMIKAITIRTNMVHIRRFLNFCASRDYMEKVEVTIPKVEKTIKEPYSDEDMRKLLARPKSREWIDWRNWAMVNYFYATGQRLSTVLNIKLEHLDLKNARVKLEWNKDKIQKYMPLSSAIIKVLQEYLDLSGLNEQDYLFPECMGKQFSKRGAEDSIADYNRSRGVYKTSIHLFRHTFAKTYIMNGGNPVKLQKLLNHKTLEMTMKYVNLYASDISDDLDLFNPLDNFKRTNYTPTQRRYVIGA